MLTPEQIEIRKTGIGASEIAAVVGLSPFRAAIDVWMEKPNPARGPLVEGDAGENDATEVGSLLEPALRTLFERRTGKRLLRPGPVTLRHPAHPHVLASPDDLLDGEDAGLEIKVVGTNMAYRWDDDTVPDDVILQCAQNMAVTGRAAWHVLALVGGTDPRFHLVERDLALEETILEEALVFWRDHVLLNVPPEIEDTDARRRYLRQRYPGSGKGACRDVGDDPEVAALMKRLKRLKGLGKRIEAAEKAVETRLFELVGEEYGIEGSGGKFLWIPMQGNVSWKSLAEEQAGGAVALALQEKHRGAKYRKPAFYPAKDKAAQSGGRKKR